MGLLSFRVVFGFLAALLLVSFVAGFPFRVCGLNEADAGVAIADAEKVVVDCYGAVLDAERAGANVTGLLIVLNGAGELLSRASLAYGAGNFDSAYKFAVWSRGNLTGFIAEAEGLKETAMKERFWDFMVNVVGSLVGAVAVVCGGFFVWFFLKRRYEKAGRVI